MCYLGFWKFVQHFIKVITNELEDETIDGNELLKICNFQCTCFHIEMFHVHGWIIDLEDETPLMDDYRVNYLKFKLHQIYYLRYIFNWSFVGKLAPNIIKWEKWFHSWSCDYLGNIFKFKFIITFLHRKLHMDPVY
jgi:hypothetical protein